jgi:hypothetical protein
LDHPVVLTRHGKKVPITRGEAVVHRVVAEALRGGHRFGRLVVQLMRLTA